jgi:hypothetical protein
MMDMLSSLAIVLCGAAAGAPVGYAGWRALTRQAGTTPGTYTTAQQNSLSVRVKL